MTCSSAGAITCGSSARRCCTGEIREVEPQALRLARAPAAPQAGRGRPDGLPARGQLVLTVWGSVIGTLIVPRPVGSWLTRWVDRFVNGAFRLATTAIADYRRRDRVLHGQAGVILLMQLVAWLGVSFLWYGLLMWPLVTGGLGSAFTVAGSSLFTLGFAEPAGAPSAIAFAAAATGLVIVTL